MRTFYIHPDSPAEFCRQIIIKLEKEKSRMLGQPASVGSTTIVSRFADQPRTGGNFQTG
ncbi:MAG: hypothetical protein QY304_01095 [Candidatus Paceibacterota bacterium]|nr:MAG: hypothetical protein QY304_01095 [Candidatus Paceibacterota bacterium]